MVGERTLSMTVSVYEVEATWDLANSGTDRVLGMSEVYPLSRQIL